MKINTALYGGAFDPPHFGHLGLVNCLRSLKMFDEIWLLPCGDREDKRLLLPMKERFQILDSIYKGDQRVRVIDDQIQMSKKLGRQIPTYEFLNALSSLHSNRIFHFVIGADNVSQLIKWHSGQQLKQQHNFVIFPRKGATYLEEQLPSRHTKVDEQLPDISSTQVKAILSDAKLSQEQREQQMGKLLPEKVLNHLRHLKMI